MGFVGSSDAPLAFGERGEGLVMTCWELFPPRVTSLRVFRAPGKAYSLGRAEYGRLGLGAGVEEKSTPTVIPELPRISSVACGASVGYAVSSDGECRGPPWAWEHHPVSPPRPSSIRPGPPTSIRSWR